LAAQATIKIHFLSHSPALNLAPLPLLRAVAANCRLFQLFSEGNHRYLTKCSTAGTAKLDWQVGRATAAKVHLECSALLGCFVLVVVCSA
jgi:hypothetical protein